MSLQQTKSILAKLLATENIRVEFQKVETAYFDVKNRVMTLPLWSDMSAELYDLLGGHEVGHALYTPEAGWHNAIDANIGKNFKTFLNVVEDARIERKIKEKFPGIRKSFSKGYNELNSRDFFGINQVDVNKLLLIDRINLHYKLGHLADIKFGEDEMVFLRRIDVAETWEEVLQVSKDIFAFCKGEMEKMREEQLQKMKMRMRMNDFSDEEDFDPPEDSSEPFPNDGVEEDNDKSASSSEADEESSGGNKDEDSDSNSSGDQSESDELEDGAFNGSYGTDSGVSRIYADEEEPISITDKKFQESVKTLSQDRSVKTAFLPGFNKTYTNKVVVDWRKLYGNIANNHSSYYKTDVFSKFEEKNKHAVLYLVKEFELRKRAAELRRVSISDTGVIDTNLLHSYKFSDNIFRKIATVADGKNHGLVALVDWSGSMSGNINGTVEQFLILTLFCRKLNIPFEVYVFSTEYDRDDYSDWFDTTCTDQLDLRCQFSLLNILSSRMSNQAFRKTATDLLNVAAALNSDRGYRSRFLMQEIVNPNLGLGGTPLNVSIVALSKVIDEFRIKNRIEVVNTVILTDGEDSDSCYIMNCRDGKSYSSINAENKHSVSYIFDDETKKSFKVGINGVTPTLLEILKARTNCNLIGFYVVENSKRYFSPALQRLAHGKLLDSDVAIAEFRKNGVYTITDWGYDEYYLIPGGINLEASDGSLEDFLDEDANSGGNKVSTRKLAGAFMRLNKNRLNSRILLKKFIEKTT